MCLNSNKRKMNPKLLFLCPGNEKRLNLILRNSVIYLWQNNAFWCCQWTGFCRIIVRPSTFEVLSYPTATSCSRIYSNPKEICNRVKISLSIVCSTFVQKENIRWKNHRSMFRGRNLINKLLKVSLLQRVGELSFVFNLFEFYKDLVKKRFRMKQIQHTLLLGKILFLLLRTELFRRDSKCLDFHRL